MKKVNFLRAAALAFLVFILISSKGAKAGCGGVCISGSENIWVYVDTLYVTWGESVSLYAKYETCCADRFLYSGMQGTVLIWFRNGIPFDTTSQSDIKGNYQGYYVTELSVSKPGTYKVFFIGFEGESYRCGKVTVIDTSGAILKEKSLPQIGFSISPNPTTDGKLFLEGVSSEGSKTLQVFNLLGELIAVLPYENNGKIELSLAGHPAGIYIVLLRTGAGVVSRKVFYHAETVN